MGMSIDFRLYRFAALSFPQTHTTLPDNIATPNCCVFPDRLLRERERSASDMEAATLRQYIPTRQRNEKTTKLEEANGSGGGEKKSVEGSAAIECFIYLRSRRRKIKIVISGREGKKRTNEWHNEADCI